LSVPPVLSQEVQSPLEPLELATAHAVHPVAHYLQEPGEPETLVKKGEELVAPLTPAVQRFTSTVVPSAFNEQVLKLFPEPQVVQTPEAFK
jgi:hypothetical protein